MLKITQKIYTLITTIFLLIIVWSTYFLLSIFSTTNHTYHSPFQLPTNTEVVIGINGQSEFKKIIHSIAIEGKGDALMKKAIEFINEQPQQEAVREYGVNWFHPTQYFKATYKGKQIQGLIVQLIDQKKWEKNYTYLFGKNCVEKSINDYTMIVQSDELTKNELKNFIDQTLQNQSDKNTSSNHFVSFNSTNKIGKIESNIDFNENKLMVKSLLTLNSTPHFNSLTHILTPADFHVTSDIIMPEVNDLLATKLQLEVLKSNPLTAISMNYRGIYIDEAILPDADAILSFEKPITINEIAQSIPHTTQEKDSSILKIGKYTYFMEQLDEKTIYIGRSKSIQLKKNTQPIGLFVQGEFTSLNIHSNAYIKAFLRMNPSFSILSDLAKNDCFIRINTNLLSDKIIQQDATFIFKANEKADLKVLEILLKRL